MSGQPTSPGKRPPATITILFCAYCGRDDRFAPFLGKNHYWGGARCPGKPVEVVYEYRAAGAS